MNQHRRALRTGIIAGDTRLPWCSGCGIGIVLGSVLAVVEDKKIEPESACLFTGVGCTGDIDGSHALRLIRNPDGTLFDNVRSWKEANPAVRPIVIINDADLFFKDAVNITALARADIDATVVYVNNFMYQTIAAGKQFLNLPFCGVDLSKQVITPDNMPNILDLSGASYVARWAIVHVRRLMYSLREALRSKGLSFIEVISPCLMYFSHCGKLGTAIDRLGMLKDMTEIKNYEPTQNVAIRPPVKIIVGRFIDRTASVGVS